MTPRPTTDKGQETVRVDLIEDELRLAMELATARKVAAQSADFQVLGGVCQAHEVSLAYKLQEAWRSFRP